MPYMYRGKKYFSCKIWSVKSNQHFLHKIKVIQAIFLQIYIHNLYLFYQILKKIQEDRDVTF